MSDNIFNQKKAFNFYRSYYETSLLLQKDDKAEFLEAILNYQFTGELIEPKSPMALLAFRGQMHSLNKQVTGYKSGKNTYPNGNPTKGTYKAKDKDTHKQVQVQEEEQEQEKEEVQVYRKFKHLSISVDEVEKLKSNGYTKIQIDEVLDKIENYSQNKKYSSLYLTANNWLKKEEQEKAQEKEKYRYKPTIFG